MTFFWLNDHFVLGQAVESPTHQNFVIKQNFVGCGSGRANNNIIDIHVDPIYVAQNALHNALKNGSPVFQTHN